jgi:outer membrane protein assembly factor BamB
MRILQGRARRFLAGGIFLILAGCAGGGDERNKPEPLTTYPAGMSARVVWRAPVGSGSGLGFAPAVVGESVYAAAPDGSVGKFDLASGRPAWKASAETRLSAGAGSDGETTAVASAQGEVIAFDDSGKIKWKARATSEVAIAPVVGGGRVVVRSGDYRIQAFDAATGERIWSAQRPGPALALRSASQMIVLDNMVISGLPGGRLIALDLANGALRWEAAVAVPRGVSDLERLADVVGAPVVEEHLLCAVSYQGRMTCFDMREGGRPAWGQDFSSASGMAVDGSHAYSADLHGVVHALSLTGGDAVWKQTALKNRALTAPAAVERAVAVGDFEGYVHFLSPADGRLLARLPLGGGVMTSPPRATAQGVLAQTGGGELVMMAVGG